jgi:hypothetical protein
MDDREVLLEVSMKLSVINKIGYYQTRPDLATARRLKKVIC